MTLKLDLLRVGYFPENLPPSFNSRAVGEYFEANPEDVFLSDPKSPVRSASYSSSKRGMSRRVFSLIHPTTAHDLAKFVDDREEELNNFFKGDDTSLSTPRRTPDGDRAVSISSHLDVEAARLDRLAGYRFIAKTDISRFYHSIYTHSIPWSFHGKSASKSDRRVNSATIFCNRLDFILRQGQDGQTIGVPVGPDASRYIAEIVAVAIDREFQGRCDLAGISAIRHVDDLWIGANSYADAERALGCYREALRTFELDINETKTRIYSENFSFSDAWPFDVSTRLETALASPEARRTERLRSALEYAFSLSVSAADDGILKYAIRQLDRSESAWDTWSTFQPFLMRSSLHFGHTLDYVARVLVWRKLTSDDLDDDRWATILLAILDRHAVLGNDSEVCWVLYAALRLNVKIPEQISQAIVANCGALSVVALLNGVEMGLVDVSMFDVAFGRISLETGSGGFWPVFLEWKARQWPRHGEVSPTISNELIENMGQSSVTIFEPGELTPVFSGISQMNFGSVLRAIEPRISSYDDGGAAPDEGDEEGEHAHADDIVF